MNSHITADFRKAFGRLPPEVQAQARKAYRLFQDNPNHPGLRFKPIQASKPYFSVRITLGYRAVGIRDKDTIIWFWIGSHSNYDQLISQL